MPRSQEILFTNTFDPVKDTPILNAILQENYHNIRQAAPSTPAILRVTGSGATNLTDNSWTALSWTTVQDDNTSMFDAGSPTLATIKEDGVYLVEANFEFSNDSVAGRRGVRFVKNGADVVGRCLYAAASGLSVGLAKPWRFQKNDTITVEAGVFGAGANTVDVLVTSPYSPTFSLTKLSN